MNNIISLPLSLEQERAPYIDVSPDGVCLMALDGEGEYEVATSHPFDYALSSLNRGHYDHDPLNGVRVIHALAQAQEKGYFQPDDQQNLEMWRWLVAYEFMKEQQRNGAQSTTENSGHSEVIYRGKHGTMRIYPDTERFAMANNIEGALIGKFGREQGTRNAILFYQGMLDHQSTVPGLSEMGRQTLADMHDEFIQMCNANELPPTPTAH
ncbi:hypothetical protein [Pectobacterium parmentieri]|uniref:Uncharacterized protein n=1 Tax=Pectobacterium parmentieri TaxID=1905730 RepID=A0A8B3FQ81_PECPM|nr:hypothetical protein [Pectobacterium parmentieri]AOR59552.1 hypothetical protein A8F97_11645 [Pectobacterium parmentieri]AYH09477.1 hypothetical protein C5E24_07120 [Pectobacterium parmentieri]AYH19814.1 hypothetical protein C5E22_15680 [Pectobacterium parmentieri]AYH35790.1 hypothetical protein C5E17_06990 [Pectobacterium parmentieri]MBI0429988.1 hypothetical protein [Pectobacterium parmentieri]